jgi:hypothetical protein
MKKRKVGEALIKQLPTLYRSSISISKWFEDTINDTIIHLELTKRQLAILFSWIQPDWCVNRRGRFFGG